MTNDNQRIENVVVVGPSDRGDAHAAVTKMRFWNEDGTPFALKGAENKTRLDDLEARIVALEGGDDTSTDHGQQDPPVEPEQPEGQSEG